LDALEPIKIEITWTPDTTFSFSRRIFPSASRFSEARQDDGFEVLAEIPRLPTSSDASLEDDVTTVMMRHIPHSVTQAYLLQVLDDSGFQNLYDFAHLRSDLRSRYDGNRGMAFVNFTSPRVARSFFARFHGHKKIGDHSVPNQVLEVLPAKLQGFRCNAEQHVVGFQASQKTRKLKPVFLPKSPSDAEFLRSLAGR
jgi:hypothetical protein